MTVVKTLLMLTVVGNNFQFAAKMKAKKACPIKKIVCRRQLILKSTFYILNSVPLCMFIGYLEKWILTTNLLSPTIECLLFDIGIFGLVIL